MNIKDAYIHNGLGVLRELQVTAAGMLQLKRAAKNSDDSYAGWEDVKDLTAIKPTNAGTADSVPWTGITGKPDTFPVATHDHDDRYLKLSGGTMTGVIERQYNAASNEPVLKIGSANKDIQIFKVYSNDIAAYSDTVSGYGYALQYIGSGSGVSNYLKLIADNSTGTKKTAMSINQSGQIGILADPNTSYALYVNGATNINGDITASSFKKSGGTSSQFLKADGSVDSNSYALSTHNHNSLDIVPIMSKTYGGTEFYATSSGNWDLASRFFMSVVPEGADKYWRVKYHIKVWVPSSNLMTDSIVEYYGSGITMKAYKIWNTHGPTHATYYHVALWLKSAGLSAGCGHMIGESILYATNYTTAASYRHMTVDLLEYEGCTVSMLDAAVKYTNWTDYSSTNYNSISSYNATSAGLQETGDNDDLSVVQQTYTLLQAGANGIKGYSLIMQDDEGKWQSIHTSAVSTGTTKNVNTAKFRLDSNVYYMNRSSDLAANSYLGTSQARVFSPNVDFRYSLNNITANGTGLTAYKPIYLVGTLDSEGYFKLDTNYWTQTAPTTADGKIYIKVCEAVYLNYSTNVNGSYTGDFGNFGIYQFRNGRLQKFTNYAVNADKLNGFSASDFRNNIIDLRTSPQTFNPTYLKDIVFISEADYTSLVSNGSITKNSITHTYNSSNWYVIPDKVPEYAETAGSVAWSNVTSKPDTATRWPSWSEVTGKPSTFNPSSHTHYATRYQDSRNTAMTPTNAVAVHGLAIDFKTKANGVNAGSGLYCGLVTMDPYSDASGGYPMQMGFNTGADANNTNELYIRTAKDADTWNEWRTVITSATIGSQSVSSATTATYASNVGAAGTAGTNYVTAAKVIATCNWYDTMTGSDTDTVINRWSEIVAFVANFTETPDLATFLSNNYLAKSGGTMTGPLKWADATALPEQTSPQYFLCIDAFNSGGTTKWASKANTLKALTGLTSTAIGDSDEPVYWDGSKFVKAGAYPTKASWNYDDVYLKLTGGTLTGALEVPASTSSGGEHTKGLNLGSVGHLGAVSATGATGVGLYSTEKIWIRPGQTNIASGTVDTTKGLVIDATTFTYNGNTVYHSGNLPATATSYGYIGTTAVQGSSAAQDLTGIKDATFSGVLNITGRQSYAEGIRIHDYSGISSIWFRAVNADNYDAGMIGITADSTGLRFRLPASATGTSVADKVKIAYGGNVSVTNALTVSGAFTASAAVYFTGLTEGASNPTDSTEILTSYASDNGFADTNGAGQVYRRKASTLYNYIKGKTDTLYVKKAGDTMTGTLTFNLGAAGYADSLTAGGINMGNSNIYGVNSIYTADASDNAAEGIHFYRDSTHVDTIWANGGNLYFVPNRAIGTGTTAANSYKIIHTGNYSTTTDTRYVLLSSTEQTIESTISSFSKGIIEFYRSSGDHIAFITFSNKANNAKRVLGSIGFYSGGVGKLQYRSADAKFYDIINGSNITTYVSCASSAITLSTSEQTLLTVKSGESGSLSSSTIKVKLPATSPYSYSFDDVTDKPTWITWSETSSTATYSLSNATWTQTITLPTTAGSYILKLVSGNSTLTGVFSIGASDNAKDEISLHLHGNGPRLYARTNGTKLELSRNIATATNTSVTITYRRMI